LAFTKDDLPEVLKEKREPQKAPSGKREKWLQQSALLRGLGKEAGENGLHLLGRVARRAFDLLLFPLLEGHNHREILFALATSEVIRRHEVTSLNLSIILQRS
jgi:hypothetical protein